MDNYPDILIVGGGVIGLTCAYYLAREGVRVEVVDQGDFGRESSWAGAGILPPGGDLSQARTPLGYMRAYSSTKFPAFSEELRERTGLDNGYLRCGGLEFATPEATLPIQEWRDEGVVFEQLDAQACRRLEPALASTVRTAYHLPGLAQLRNPRHIKALLAGCRSYGVRLRPGCPIHGFKLQGDRVLAAKSIAGLLHAGRFLLATGAWTDSLLYGLGHRPGIRPIRGQIALLNSGTPWFRRVLALGKRYLVPRPDGRVLVGSTEEDVGFDKRTTAEAIKGLLDFAIAMIPDLAGAPLERAWSGLRPGSPDDLPFLGPVPGSENLLISAGHFRAGIQFSLPTAQMLKELYFGQPLTIPLESFRLDRSL